MATSGVMTFRLNRDQVLTQALINVAALDPEAGTPTPNQVTHAATHLNLMVKAWEAHSLQLWERKYGVIFPQKNQGMYVLGNPGPAGDHAVLTDNLNLGDFIQTTVSVAAVASATSVTLTSITNVGTVGNPAITLANTWFIGIELDSGFLFWTTVNGAPAGNVVTLTAGLPSSASAGLTVYAYQTKLMRPLRILDAFYRQQGGNDIPIRLISREEYNRFGVKTSQGTPIQLFYDPQINTGLVELYPQPTDVKGQIYIEFQKPIEDFVTSTDDFDLPQEWGEALIWNLSLRLAVPYRVPTEQYNRIEKMAVVSLDLAKNWDQEYASILFQPSEVMYMGTGRG